MTPGAFKCSRCDRSFSMAAHLARHQNTIHGGGGRRKGKVGRPKMKRGPGRPRKAKVGRPAGRRGPLARSRMAAMDGAARLMSQMRDYYTELTSRRATLDAQITGIESAISSLGGGAVSRGRPGRRPGRPAGRKGRRRGRMLGGRAREAREGSLKDMIGRVLRQGGAAQSPQEIASSVIRAGYKTKTHDLSKAVSNALPQMKNIRRVGRGLYAA